MKRNFTKTYFKRGSALIAVIAAIAIFSVLAAALLSLTSTSLRQTVQSHLADRAYFMAESGYRYATTQYQHPPAAYPDPMDALENMGDRATFDGTDGRFDLALFSYFYELTAPAAAGATMLTVRTPGSFPSDEIEITSLTGQKVFIQGNTYTLTGGSGLVGEDQLNLAINPALHEAVDAKTLAYPLTDAGIGSPWDITNRTIGFVSGQADMFPLRNGRIRVGGRTLAYLLKDDTNNVLTDIEDIHGNDLSGFNIPAGAPIRLLPYIRVDATGIIGGDNVLVQRKVSYFGSLPAAFSETYTDTFNDPDTILATPRGTHDIGTIDDTNPVLKVTGGDAQGLFLSQLDVGETGDDTANAARENFNDFRGSSGGYLSYDAQTKVGFFTGTEFDPNFIHGHDLAAGLSFRVYPEVVAETTEYNMYGLSFMNRQTNTILPPGIIPPGVDLNDTILILWQQTIDASDTIDPVKQTWLAYKKLSTTLFEENFNGCTAIDTCCADIGNCWTNTGSPPWEIIDGALFIETYAPAMAQSPLIDIPEPGSYDDTNIILRFRSSIQNVHPYDISSYAIRQVWIVHGGGTTRIGDHNDLFITQISGGDYLITADLQYIRDQIIGSQIQIQFRFDRESGLDWRVDDVVLTNESPIHNSTLLVRLKEAAAIPFNYTGAATIETEDRLVGETSGTRGTVVAPPTIQTGPPDGYVLLNSLSEASWFNANEILTVLGKGNIATVNGAPDEATFRKTNIIKVYYASEAGDVESTPDPSSPLDRYTLPYERLESNETLKWPVQDGNEWTADKDYFRLIQWDEVNDDGTDPNIDFIQSLPDTINGSPVDHTIVLSHQEKLQSPDISVILSAPELGLHAMGSDAFDHVYFDDLGFRLYYLPDTLFPAPLQQ